MRVFYGRSTISIVAMQCVFCVFWQDSDIYGSDAMHISYGRTADNDVNDSDAVRVLCILAGQRYQLQRCNVCFLMAGQRIQW